jgi:hypothetical protein
MEMGETVKEQEWQGCHQIEAVEELRWAVEAAGASVTEGLVWDTGTEPTVGGGGLVEVAMPLESGRQRSEESLVTCE